MSLHSNGSYQTGDTDAQNGLDSLFNFLVQSSVPEPERSNTQPPKRGKKRKKTKNGAYLDDITEEQLLSLTHLPTSQAAKVLKVGTTSFKRVCRLHGIHTWPYKSRTEHTLGMPQAGYASLESVGRATVPPAPVTDETQRLIEIVSDDILRVSDIQMPINYAADTTSISSLVKTVKLSQTMRRTSGVSIFNDGVLLKLLERLSKVNAGQYHGGSQ